MLRGSLSWGAMAGVLPVVYSDLNCPFCFALSEWLEAWGASRDVLWRGVEHEPHLRIPAAPTHAEQEALRREVEDVQRRAPGVGVVLPSSRPSSGPALAALAQLAEGSAEAATARTRVFRALWRDGRDISQRVVLSELLGDLGVDVDALDPEPVRQATAAWRHRGWDRIPVIESGTGALYLGLGEPRLLDIFLGSALFDIERGGVCRVES